MIQTDNIGVSIKADLYMKRFILPKFDPNRIFWWFSISGGKDSYTMSRVIWEWYKKHDYKFSGKGFFINQWKVSNYRYLKKKFFWMDIEEINAIEITEKTINYKSGQQAPCRECADIRRNINDRYIRDNFVPDKYNFIARGLHFSDTCISLLWRSVFSPTPFEDYSFQQKGFPIVELSEYTYLVKPLLFVREYESAQYAASCGFIPCCCGCPGCKYPSRRDIVEETVLKFYDADPLWEFQIPGIKKYLNQLDEELWDILQAQSLQGSVVKNNRIPDDFYDFALQSFEGRLNNTTLFSEELDENLFLDTIGTQWLLKTIRQPQNISRIPAPKLIKNIGLITPHEKRMIATLGPFWGAIGCKPQFQAKIWDLQKKIFDFEVDISWSQSNKMLNNYYKNIGYVNENSKTDCFLCLHHHCRHIGNSGNSSDF